MQRNHWTIKVVLAVSLWIASLGIVSGQDLPVIQGKKVVATVNGEPIPLEELNRELAGLQEGMAGKGKVEKKKRSELLNRLITGRLLIQEARGMGLDELKEVRERVDVFRRVALRDELLEQHVKNIKPDEKEVEKRYRESIKEIKIKSILFDQEENAKKMEQLLKEGKNFDETLKKFLGDRTGKGSEEGNYLKSKDLLPEVAAAISKMKIGSISPSIRIQSGFTIFKLEEIRFSEEPGQKERTRMEVLRWKQTEAQIKYSKALRAKYTKINIPLLKRLDFDSKEPGFDKLLKDKRVVAEIKGEKPVTVGELAEYMKQQLYHGVQMAVEAKRLNKKKELSLDEMLDKRVLRKEALRLGLDKTESYQNRVREYEDSLVFGAFVQKAIAPDMKLKEEDLKAYHHNHLQEFTNPEMMKIVGLVFGKRSDAEKAITSLKKGTAFQWVKSHAEGQMNETTKGLLNFDGKLLMTKDLPAEVKKAISGARAGDFRLYETTHPHYYVLHIQEVVPAQPKPYTEVRETIARKVYDEKLKKAVEEYADKLRAASEVKVYLKD